MVLAERVALVESGVAGLRVRDAMIDLHPCPRAAFHRAPGRRPQEGDPLRGVGPASEVGDVVHVDACGDDELEDALTEQFPRHGHRYRTDPRDLAQLTVVDAAGAQRREVDPDQREGGGACTRGRVGTRCRELDERVERATLAR